ncbi:MAG: ribonuclease M5 [Bacilli bacterium]
MSKYVINAVLIVEGTSDVNYLSSFIDAEFIITNGSEVSQKTINTIKTLSQNHDIIVFTDPDGPGKRIRDIITQNVPQAKHAFVKKELSIKGKKVGVAECQKSEVLRALNEIKTFDFSPKNGTITLQNMYQFDLTGSDAKRRRNYVSEKLGIDEVNVKTLCKRLNQLNVTLDELATIMKGYK